MNYVALLRGINLGNRRLKMDRLRALFEEAGFTSVETFIASGNVIFDSFIRSAAKLEQTIEKHLEKSLGYPVATFIRTRAEIAQIAAARPFGADHDNPDCTISACFCKAAPTPEAARRLEAIRTDVDRFKVVGREYFWRCGPRISDSEVWNHPEMKTLELPNATMRNMTSVQKLASLWPPK